MKRHAIAPRPDWPERAALLDFNYANVEDGSYWDETACWELTSAEVNMLDATTAELERLCRLAVGHAVREDRREVLGLSGSQWSLVCASWRRGEPSLYGRMDLRWDGDGPPKLLEYNADTPTTLYEASIVQWEWLQCVAPDADQFNSLHEALIASWRGLKRVRQDGTCRIHFTCMRDWIEDRGTIDYLRDTAVQAGIDAPFIALEDVGWGGGRFRDVSADPIATMFKLYPWDWMLSDAFGCHVSEAPTSWIEPAWRLALASKGILALLWELFPGHPNLLPAYRTPGRTGGPEIAKPLHQLPGAVEAVHQTCEVFRLEPLGMRVRDRTPGILAADHRIAPPCDSLVMGRIRAVSQARLFSCSRDGQAAMEAIYNVWSRDCGTGPMRRREACSAEAVDVKRRCRRNTAVPGRLPGRTLSPTAACR